MNTLTLANGPLRIRIPNPKPFEIRTYQPSSFHRMKGDILRACIHYLHFLRTTPTTNVKLFFLNARIRLVPSEGEGSLVEPGELEGDERQIRARAHSIIQGALRIAESWVREQTGIDLVHRLTEMGLDPKEWVKDGYATEDEVLDRNYHFTLIQNQAKCPPELDAAGIRGLYDLMKLSHRGQEIYSGEAQRMANLLDDIVPFAQEEDGRHIERGESGDPDRTVSTIEMMERFRGLLKHCTGQKMIVNKSGGQ
ncbi:hypothetical protein E1B28_008145 [Marasmius oreades]|uniref:Uncharacterized protein n=1 Tax=Marasmius oreades TaxID=181124 RepID=A0A9P7UU00_9AGAR|nr:uncharacterized protein E1B28_008145 [Marasmius oreades]KAG7091744.1 hypothetical protein E1B28_008145 [Marasmius oreades]